MTVSFFDIIRHKIAVWVVFPLLLVLSVATYQYAYYTPTAVVIEMSRAQLNSLRYGPALEKQTPLVEFGAQLQSVKELTQATIVSVESYQETEQSALDGALNFIGIQTDTGTNLSELESKIDRIIELESFALESFDEMYRYLIDISADSVIFERHDAAVEKFQSAIQPVKDIRTQLGSTNELVEQQRLLQQLDEYLSTQQFKRNHTAEDFEDGSLPFGPRNLQAREPLLDLSSLETELYDSVDIAANTLTIDILKGLVAPSSQPTIDDIAETEEAPQTQDIIDLAASLNNDPIEIYNWVYNNIYSIPSYGAIQGAQYTLDLKAGNPFDTSALLLALLRAAGTPARYAYGTVEVPVDQVMNWVGGAEVPEAAAHVMLQGGIPTTLASYNGELTHVKFEHIWVEAWVDFEPSRGMVNLEGDHWIPMDSSFKQYDYEVGMALEAAVPFDAEGLVTDLLDTATVDENAGYVQGLDQARIQQALTDYQAQVEDYVNNQNPDATVGDVLGLQQIPIKERAPLSAGLPYQVIDRAPQIQIIPDSFKHKFRIKLDYDSWGSTAIDETYNTVALAGKNIAISFEPANQRDIDLIASYIPEVADGEELDISQLPDQLPGYLIYVKPELTIDGETITATGSVSMGTELTSQYALYDPAFGWSQSENNPVAGEYIAVGLDLQGIAPTHVQKLQNQLEVVEAQIAAGDISTLTKHDVVGGLIQANIIGYFGMNDAHDTIAKRTADQLYYRAPSYGQFQTKVQALYWFGIPRNVEFPSVVMDVDRLSSIGDSKTSNVDERKVFNEALGVRQSYMENWIPEQMFSTDTEQVEGISATKALVVASALGQKIYTLELSNIDQLNNITIDNDAYNEIRSALYSGKTVTVHEAPLNYAGWSGSGYIITDDLGAGAYKISGGSNGGELDFSNATGPIGALIAVVGYLQGVADVIDKLAGGPLKKFLGPLGNIIGLLGFLISLVDQSDTGNCSPSDMTDLILLNTLYTIIMLALSQAVTLLALGPIGIFIFLTFMGVMFSLLLGYQTAARRCV